MTPRSVWSSTVLGMTAAAAAWGIGTLLHDQVAAQFGPRRLDQFTMWLVGGLVGAVTLGGRSLRSGESVLLDLLGGLLAGAATMATAATVVLQLPLPASPVGFILLRAAGWGWCGALTALGLALMIQHRKWRAVLNSSFIGLVGGTTAGVICALPGPEELWQGAAMLVLGAALGAAIVQPLLRDAVAVVDRLPRRGVVPGILSLRESALFEGGAVALGAATLACQGGWIALHPPAAGVVYNGRAIGEPVFLRAGGVLLVADQRFRIQLMGPRR